tara:strand:- start:273 stop:389 length:117 start_codon:yes stop_codon:yes gene_type:complete
MSLADALLQQARSLDPVENVAEVEQVNFTMFCLIDLRI